MKYENGNMVLINDSSLLAYIDAHAYHLAFLKSRENQETSTASMVLILIYNIRTPNKRLPKTPSYGIWTRKYVEM